MMSLIVLIRSNVLEAASRVTFQKWNGWLPLFQACLFLVRD